MMGKRSKNREPLRLSIWEKPRGTIRQFAHAISGGEPDNLTEEDVYKEILEAARAGTFDGRIHLAPDDRNPRHLTPGVRWENLRSRDEAFTGDKLRKGMVRCLWATSLSLHVPAFECVSDLTPDEYQRIQKTGYLDRMSLETVAVADWLARRASVIQSGLPGPPTSKHLVLIEAKRRIDAKEMPATLAAFAREMSQWLAISYPTAPQMGAGRAENLLRELWRAKPSA